MSGDDLDWTHSDDDYVHCNAGTVAFVDAAVLDDTENLTPVTLAGRGRVDGLLIGSHAVTALSTGEDNDYLCEVSRAVDGTLLAARLEFVDDVADVEGEWRPIGEVEITSGRMLACDPYTLRSPWTYVVLDAAAGRYRLEAFHFLVDGVVTDHLGLRAIRIGG